VLILKERVGTGPYHLNRIRESNSQQLSAPGTLGGNFRISLLGRILAGQNFRLEQWRTMVTKRDTSTVRWGRRHQEFPADHAEARARRPPGSRDWTQWIHNFILLTKVLSMGR